MELKWLVHKPFITDSVLSLGKNPSVHCSHFKNTILNIFLIENAAR